MKKVKDISAVPRGGTFTYVHEEGTPGEFVQKHPYFSQLKQDVLAYKIANHLPVGLLFDEEFEQNVCAHAADVTCEEFIPPTLLEKMSSLTQALYRAAKNGFRAVTAEQFEERKSICGTCNFYRGDNGLLKIACSKCGCSGLKLAAASERCPINRW